MVFAYLNMGKPKTFRDNSSAPAEFERRVATVLELIVTNQYSADHSWLEECRSMADFAMTAAQASFSAQRNRYEKWAELFLAVSLHILGIGPAEEESEESEPAAKKAVKASSKKSAQKQKLP